MTRNMDRAIFDLYLQSRDKADCVENVILMRSDVHDQFDNYQFTYRSVCNVRSTPACIFSDIHCYSLT